MTPAHGDTPELAARRRALIGALDVPRELSPRVRAAMMSVPRHEFVPLSLRHLAYEDMALEIGHEQTISQPTVVALMTDALELAPSDVALDVGTGSGYQAAILAVLAKQVHSIEIVAALAEESRARLRRLGYANVEVRCGDGYRGWAEHAPFDAICVAASVSAIPAPLVAQLAPGGRMVLPVGNDLVLLRKLASGALEERRICAVTFVPFTGEGAAD
jgi:protein-L-isoaspartate(D-aspartate) O-methyltransferase